MSSLNQTKCFMLMADFMHCRIIHKNICVYTIHGGKEAWSTRYQDQYFEILYRQPRRAFFGSLD